MTTYYGVWLGENKWHSLWLGQKWWHDKDGVAFYTPILGVAEAQAIVANEFVKREFGEDVFAKMPHWEARAIGEDGLPMDELAGPRNIMNVLKELAKAFKEAGL